MNSTRARFFTGDIAILFYIALAKFLIHALLSQQYGYFIDEFYYIAASKRLAFGYVDFPPFIAVLTALVRATLGESLAALRLLPALAGSVAVFVTGLMARQLGGRRSAQVLAALCSLTAGVFLSVNSMLSMDSFDQLWWALAALVLILIFQGKDARLWLLFGLIAGIGLTTKMTMLYFGFAVAAGMLLSSQRRQLRIKWLWLGGAMALSFLLPYLAWNAANGWPTLGFWSNYADKVFWGSALDFLLQQVLIMNPFTLPVWLVGLYFYFSYAGYPPASPDAGRPASGQGEDATRLERADYRPLGWAYVLLLLIFTLQHAKHYFLAPAYPMLFAAGAVFLEAYARQRRWVWVAPAAAAMILVSGLLVAPLSLPLLPPAALAGYMRLWNGVNIESENSETGLLPQHFADRFGWVELAAAVEQAYDSLPPEEQAQACIFAGSYGQAGALELHGAGHLPTIISSHNNYFLWGPQGCSGEVMILAISGVTTTELSQLFGQFEVAATTDCTYCMPRNDALPIWVARQPKAPLQALWPSLVNFE
ncbi:MAG: ArnT family glycosyltransferase [Chloroflexota bacterium]